MDFIEQLMFEQRLIGNEETVYVISAGKGFLVTGNNQCKDPEVRMCLTFMQQQGGSVFYGKSILGNIVREVMRTSSYNAQRYYI